MVIDHIDNANKYYALGKGIEKALRYLQSTDFTVMPKDKYVLDGEQLFAIVNEYDTVDPLNEQMEAHKKYVDVQFIVQGEECIGHATLQNQTITKPYSDVDDYLLVLDPPKFFSKLTAGMFSIFYPTDLHAPNLHTDKMHFVKKVVIKVAVESI
jgi:YhcH/YjgK/YiaL family protein